ncbi:MAG: response regulator [candidate division KSB1 bacterium]|nr:response regulator [candidate division KSB1 bacterium]
MIVVAWNPLSGNLIPVGKATGFSVQKRSYRAVIVDDEWLIRSELRMLLGNFPEISVVGEAATVYEAAEVIRRTRPDVVFLDIQMPGESGLRLLDMVERDFEVVFVTAYPQYREEAMKFRPKAYLLKPIRVGDLSQVIAQLAKGKESHEDPGSQR